MLLRATWRSLPYFEPFTVLLMPLLLVVLLQAANLVRQAHAEEAMVQSQQKVRQAELAAVSAALPAEHADEQLHDVDNLLKDTSASCCRLC
jgi:hypothetical protein